MLILADDFTGALDTGIQFAKSGARTRVITDTDCDFSGIQAQVLVIDTETRHLRPSEAGNVIGKIVRRAAASGITFFYKKTDSALRGNAGAEMEALLAASGGKCLHFLPAFPQMNRLVRDGVLYIDSVPVAESVFGKDPFEPVLKSSVPEILAAQTALPVLTADELTEEAEGIIVYNSESQEELRRLASSLPLDRRPLYLAGCAGLASCLTEALPFEKGERAKLPGTEGFLVVSGSVNEVTLRQIGAAKKDGFGYEGLSVRDKLTDYLWTAEGSAERRALLARIMESDRFVLDTADPASGENALDWGKRRGMDARQVGSRIADTLARLVKEIVETDPDRLLLLTGGDVLFHTMNVLGVTELEPLEEVSPGVILSLYRLGSSVRPVLTKSGGFGEEDLFVRLADHARSALRTEEG
jgi:uncharacterized protein YgbK (DUF1537 family)